MASENPATSCTSLKLPWSISEPVLDRLTTNIASHPTSDFYNIILPLYATNSYYLLSPYYMPGTCGLFNFQENPQDKEWALVHSLR